MHRIAALPRWVRWIVAALAAFASTEIAGAACTGFGPDFGQFSPNCNGGYCYVVSPGQHTPQTLAGTFWNFGAGQPATGQGQDNGSWPVGSWLPESGADLYLAGGWQVSPAIDGCIAGTIAPGKSAEIMVALISDYFLDGLFAVAAVRRVIGATPEFDFTFVNGGGLARDITLTPIPRARIAQFNRPYNFEMTAPTLGDVSAGIYGDGSLLPGELVKGYRVYTSEHPLGPRPGDGWTAATGIVPLGQNVTLTVPWQYEMSFAYTLVFDGNFETPYLGQRTRVASTPRCEVPPLDDDHDGYYFWPDPSCAPDSSMIDCNDVNAAVHPGALEICNGIDDNCNNVIDDVATPGSVDALQLGKLPGGVRLEWPALPVATGYDVVRGDLTELAISGGSFSAATQACLANDVATSHVDDAENPDPGYGFWYLLRAGNCTGVGSYDDPTQVTPRGPGIAASGHACP